MPATVALLFRVLARSPQLHVPITVGTFYRTHTVNFSYDTGENTQLSRERCTLFTLRLGSSHLTKHYCLRIKPTTLQVNGKWFGHFAIKAPMNYNHV